MDQINSQQLARHGATTSQASASVAPAGNFALVLLMPISFILTVLTIVMLQR